MSTREARPPEPACPRCGSVDVAEILYGLPAFDDGLEADLAAGRVVLGGCLVWDEQPDLACNACGLEFRTDDEPVEPGPLLSRSGETP